MQNLSNEIFLFEIYEEPSIIVTNEKGGTMNKADKIFICLVIVLAILSYVPLLVSDFMNSGKKKEAVVSFKNDEILRLDLYEDGIYSVEGTLGPVDVEIQDEAVRVEKENSPYHLCSIQGWVSQPNRPIICLPNNIVVEIQASETDNDVDTVIQ